MKAKCKDFWCIHWYDGSDEVGCRSKGVRIEDECQKCEKFCKCEHCILQDHGEKDCETLAHQLYGYVPWEGEGEF